MAGIRAKLEQLAERARESLRFTDPGPEPGSSRWLAALEDDVDQAQRNETDCTYVVVRRETSIRRAGEDRRWPEIVALAEIESRADRLERAHRRVSEALDARQIPACAHSFFPGLIGRIAGDRRAQGNGSGARELFEKAHDVASDADEDELVVRLLLRRASFELETHAVEHAEAATTEGLLRLGWGTGSDPYRKGPPRARPADNWERRALVALVRTKVKCLASVGASEEARRLLAELRESLGDAASSVEHRIAADEAWLAYRDGSYDEAAAAWQKLHAHFESRDDHAAARSTLTNVGWAHLRRGDTRTAAELAQQVVALPDVEESTRARCNSLAAEAALAQGDDEAARRHATASEDSEDAIARTGALRVLAEVCLAGGELDPAMEHARRAVDESLAAFGRDLYVVDRLLTLARVALERDVGLAQETLDRAAAIPMAQGHPFRAEIERLRSELPP